MASNVFGYVEGENISERRPCVHLWVPDKIKWNI